MAAVPFTTQNKTFLQIMEPGIAYQVPPFQRDYSWTENEWEVLWQDILLLPPEQEEQSHFMGFLVLQRVHRDLFTLLDGQQRLTTISLLILAAIKCLQELTWDGLDAASNQRREEYLRRTYLENFDLTALVSSSKLTLNHCDDDIYKYSLLPLKTLPCLETSASENLLRDAFCWFKERIEDTLGHDEDSGLKIAHLVESVASSLFFAVVTVDNAASAFLLFESLNVRGTHLSATDLLKNDIFACLGKTWTDSPRALDHLETRWRRITDLLGEDAFPEFLRIVWNSSHTLVRKNALFQTIHAAIQEQGQALALLDELEQTAPICALLRTPFDTQWTRKEQLALQALEIFAVQAPCPCC